MSRLASAALLAPIQSLAFVPKSASSHRHALTFTLGCEIVFLEDAEDATQKMHLDSKYWTSIKGVKVHQRNQVQILFLYGQKTLVYCVMQQDGTPGQVQYIFTANARDWIMEMEIVGDTLILGYPHNSVEVFALEWGTDSHGSITCVAKSQRFIKGTRNCLLYSMAIVRDPTQKSQVQPHFLIASGTIFGQIILWDSNGHEMAYLQGHEGSVFSLAWTKNCDAVASTSDDRTVRYWRLKRGAASQDAPSTFQLLSTKKMYGHYSRIWDCKFLERDNLIVSAGEDATIRLWNIESGECVHILKGHFVKSIWALAISPDEKWIASAGGDSSVKLWPLDTIRASIQQKNQWDYKVPDVVGLKKHMARGFVVHSGKDARYPQTLVVASSGNVYAMQPKQDVQLVYENPDTTRRNCVNIVRVVGSPCERYIAVGLGNGECYILDMLERREILRFIAVERSKPLGMYWFTHERVHHLFATLPDGRTRHFVLDEACKKSEFLREYHLKQVCTHLHYLPEKHLLISGDKLGKVHLCHAHVSRAEEIKYLLSLMTEEDNSEEIAGSPTKPYHTQSKLHSSGKIVSLGQLGNQFYTLSVDGTMWQLRLEYSTKIEAYVFVKENLFRFYIIMPHIEHMYVSPTNGDIILSGYHGSYFVVYNLTQRCRLISLEAGGVRRMHLMHYNEHSGYYFSMSLKDSVMRIFQAPPNANQPVFRPFTSVYSLFHGRGLYSVHALSMGKDSTCLMTTSEDCMCRMTEVSSVLTSTNPSNVYPLHCLEIHESPVRTVNTCPRVSNFCSSSDASKEHIMVVGGGKEELSIYTLRFQTGASNSSSSLSVQSHPHKVQTTLLLYERLTEQFLHFFHPNLIANEKMSNDILFRIMSCAVFPVENTAQELYIIVIGGSDAKVKLFLWNMRTLIPVGVCTSHTGVVKKMASHRTSDGRYLLVSSATDSRVLCFDLTRTVEKALKQHLEQRMYDGLIRSSTKSMSKRNYASLEGIEIINFVPQYQCEKLHQSGVNALSIHVNEERNEMHVLSGGDDQCLHLQVISLRENEQGGFNRVRLSSQEAAHCATVSGVFTDGVVSISTSTDQRVNVYQHDNSGAFNLATSTVSSVADPMDMNVLKRDGEYEISVVGEGMEVLRYAVEE